MGTRNLTCVVKDGKHKVAQYAQWDGGPNGQGLTILNFISDGGNLDKLKEGLGKVRFLDVENRDKAFMESYNANAPEWSNDPDNRTPEQMHWFKSYVSRDIGAKILENITNSSDEEILLRDNSTFAADSLMCEWAYVVDFDKNTFEVYKGFNTTPLDDGERFKDMKDKNGYHPVRLVCEFDLNALPNESSFLDSFKDDDEDE